MLILSILQLASQIMAETVAAVVAVVVPVDNTDLLSGEDSTSPGNEALTNVNLMLPKINQNEWRIRNSHCFYFGIYSFNLTRWQSMDANEMKNWCNKTDGEF